MARDGFNLRLTRMNLKLNLSGPVLRDVLTKAGYKYLAITEKMIKQGMSVKGGKFLPYSAEYGMLKSGRQGWLQLTGAMLASRQVNVKGTKMTIVISGSRPNSSIGTDGKIKTGKGQVTNAVIAFANDRTRPFMGLNAKGQKEMAVFLKAELLKVLKKQ